MNKQQTVIITGASSGIGLALASAFLQRGDNVVGNARTLARLETAADQLGNPENFLPVAGDIGRPETAPEMFARAIERFGAVDVLVNNAGIFSVKPFVDYTEEDLEGFIDTNLKGFVYPTREAARHMSERQGGHIVTVTASIAMQPLHNVPASLPILIKGGLNQATKALALELAPANIKVSAVAPGIIDTPLYTGDMHEFLKTLQPAGRLGTVEEIVEAVLYLTGADYTTGVVLPVDGGMTAGRW